MKRVLVIGDSCEDIFVYGKCDRICPEAPVPVFVPVETKINGGMSKNVFNNLGSLNPSVEYSLITNPNKIIKTRYVDYKTNQMIVRVDEKDKAVEVADMLGVNNFRKTKELKRLVAQNARVSDIVKTSSKHIYAKIMKHY